MLGAIDVSESVVPDGMELVVIVNTCSCPTSFTLGAEMLMFASTNRFVAGPLPPGPAVPEVERVTLAVAGFAPGSLSAKPQMACAFAVKTPAEALLIWNEQVAVLPPLLNVGLPHVLFRIGVALPTMLGVSDVSDGVVPDGVAVLVTVNV